MLSREERSDCINIEEEKLNSVYLDNTSASRDRVLSGKSSSGLIDIAVVVRLNKVLTQNNQLSVSGLNSDGFNTSNNGFKSASTVDALIGRNRDIL
jgi:hypothetical protein